VKSLPNGPALDYGFAIGNRQLATGNNNMDALQKDIRFGIRSLLRQPGFTAIAVITLALGIGINAALFSVVNSVLLNPLPFPEPEQLVTFDQSKPNFETGAIPYPNFLDLRKENQTFSAMTILRATSFSLIGAGESERVNGRYVSADFCSVFGIKPILGRGFAAGEDETGAAATVLISNALWQRKFGGAHEIVNRAITLDGRSFLVAGVLPADFTLFRNADVFVPIGQWTNPGLRNRGAALGLHGMGRLKPGVTVDQAQADLNRVMQNLALAYPDTNKGNGSTVGSLKERLIGDIRGTLWLLLGAVGFVLLIACVNVGNLMLARATGRRREFAIRGALGAGRWQLVRQSLTETTILALTGGALGLIIAAWATQAAVSILPATLPRASEVRVDYRVLLFALAVSLLSGILSGLAPALRNSHWQFSETLKEASRGNTSRGRAQTILVAVEVALAVVLLIGGGLMVRSLRALWSVDPGFRADNVLTFGLSLSPATRDASPQTIRSTLRQLNAQLNATPGVRGASFSAGGSPLQGEDDLSFWIDGKPKPASQAEMNMALVYRVEPSYLTVMGIPLKEGRFFDDHDTETSQPVVVIDEIFAHKYFPAVDPIGKRICQNGQEPQMIVGVAGHVKQWGLDSDENQSLRAQLYEPFRQLPDNVMSGVAAGLGVVVLGDGSPSKHFDSIRRTIQNQNLENVVFTPQTMNEAIAQSLSERRFAMVLLESFALLALLLAAIGLYGVVSYLVGQRTQELGIRIALGAQRSDVLRLVLADGVKMVSLGVVSGLVASLGLTRLLTNMVYGVSPNDPATFAVIAVLLVTVALCACLIPARRATRVDPLIALRYE
jgi:putative ABC transport system permease protein